MTLSYRALRYFYIVARAGTLRRASAELHVSEPAIHAQIRKLQRWFGADLFERRGRGMVLTESGRDAYQYAERIFELGDELARVVRDGTEPPPLQFTVGLVDTIPKMLALRLLEPAIGVEGIRTRVLEGSSDRLLAELATHAVDAIIADLPVPIDRALRAYSHPLGTSDVSVFGHPDLAGRLERWHPADVHGLPWLLPTPESPLRRGLDQWFVRWDIRPNIVAEFQDSALMKSFGSAGLGLFAGPSAVEADIEAQYGVEVLLRTDEIRESFYLINLERQITHPALIALSDGAASRLGE